ncbi:MAG: 1-acyl-sn-glycerol-3-phosphate acyltransferase [Bacteroidia bacterium]|jgi:1-acyl-sn-glycerol-3-phosphate acyltransferase
MLYYIIKFSLLLYTRIYFKRVYISGASNIPKNKPVFLASNHSNGFLDGTMVSSLLFPRATRIFVRGDVFGPGWANFLLRGLKLIPIFRARDGATRQNAIGNNASFDQLYKEFQKNRVVLIFPEADAQIEKRLRPLKKGMSRMIVDMQSRGDRDMEVAVVPLGLNYTHYKSHRSEIMISFSTPIYLKDYLGEDGNERIAYNNMTEDVGRRIKSEMVDINQGDEKITETALRLVRQEQSEPIVGFWFHSNERLKREIAASDKVKHSAEDSALRLALTKYQNTLDSNNVSEVGSKKLKIWQYIFWFIFIIPSSLSWLIMGWGLYFGQKVVDAKIKKDELYESVYFGVGLAYNWILVMVGYTIFGILFGWYGLLGWFIYRWLSIPYQHCMDFWDQFKMSRRWSKSKLELETLRATVLTELNA